MPDAEVDLSVELVAALIAEQHPDLAHLPLTEVAAGWDNVVYRLGDELAVRVPRRQAGADLVEHEQRWLPELAERLPVSIPVAERVGMPSALSRWRWSIVRWVPGTTYAPEQIDDPERFAEQLGHALAALHTPAPDDAPENPYRGGPLHERNEITLRRLDAAKLPDADEVREAWSDALAAEDWTGPSMWLHGDLHPLNMVVANGQLAALIDFGDITSGDPATDLMVAWTVLDAPHRATFRAAADSALRPIDDAMWRRARGWAISHGCAMLESEIMADLGRRSIAAAVADF